MSYRNLSRIMCVCAALGAAVIVTGQEVRSKSGDVLAFTADGAWKSATMGKQQLPLATGTPVLSICDVERGGEYLPMLGSVRAENGGVTMTLSSEPMALKATLRIESDGEVFKFKLRIEDTTGKDRGLLVRVGLPVDAKEWAWWDDLNQMRLIEPGKLYENVKPLRAFAALPEWKDKPDLRMGYNTENFCSVITGQGGLCLAVPLDQPRIFRTAYDARQKLFGITYDAALCKETATPSQAAFEFELFECDKHSGMRSALDAYYKRHPEFFKKHLTEEGMWVAFTSLDTIDNTTEFGIGVQEGAGSVGYDDKIGVKSFSYYTHAGMYADVPDHKRGVDPTPSLERRIAAVEATFKRNTGHDGVYAECGLHDAKGQLSAEPGTVYGDVLAQFCLEPDMFYGRWLLDRIDKFFDDFRKRGELDGFYYDGLTTGINYRREHFRHAAYPPSWDPVSKKPYLYNYFSSVAWSRQVAEKLHGMGKFTMMNGAMSTNPFCAPYLDVMGAETGPHISRNDFSFVKSICHHKPFMTLLKGNYAKMTSAEIELFMKHCLAYGVFPGFFDWPPSGLGPGGTYWDHPEYYERDRLLFRKYQPLVRTIAAAGWEPMKTAWGVRDSTLQAEQFGPSVRGNVFFTILNDSKEFRRSDLAVAAVRFEWPAENLVVFDEVSQRRLVHESDGAILRAPMELPPQSVALIHIAKKADFIAYHLDEAAKIFEVADVQRKADEGRPARPRYWRVTEERCFRDGGALLLRNDSDRQVTTAQQWAMLFQEKACPITVRARVRTQDVTGAKNDKFALQAVVCYVDKQFTTRDPRVLPLEPGSGEWQNVEWTIEPTRPVRSIQLTLRFNGRRGSAWFKDVSVRSNDAPDKECAVDGGFDAWYEKLTPEQTALLAPKMTAVRSALSSDGDAARKLTAAFNAIQAASEIITEQHLENPARREHRDLDAAREHLMACASVELGVEGLELTAPEKTAPGEKIEVGVKVLSSKQTVRGVKSSLRSENPLKITANSDSLYEVAIPADARPGDVIVLHGEATVELAGGGSLPLRAEKTITIVAPFETEATVEGVNPDASQTVVVRLANNLSRPQKFKSMVNAPTGWTTGSASQEETVAPNSSAQVRVTLTPDAATKPGRHEVGVAVQSEGASEPKSFRLEMNHVPATANRLKNGGFESSGGAGLESWGKWEGGFATDANVIHSGRQSLRLQTDAPTTPAGAYQGVALNQKAAAPLIVRGWCKTEKVAGDPLGCCLYVDIYYADGTKLYGQKIPFDHGTHDWQFREMRIPTTKPAKTANVYIMLRGVAGTAWFDDVVLAEDAVRAE